MIAFSFTNLAAAATIAASTTFLDAVHPATRVLDALRPFKRAWSADLTAQRLTVDLGSTTALAVIALGHANFTAVTIQGNASDSWGAPTYNQAVTIGVSSNDRYHHAHRPTAGIPFNLRYLSLSIPNQVTTDGAAVFKLGYIYAGAIVLPPREIRDEPEEEKLEAREDLTTRDGRLLQRLILDDPVMHVTMTRQAKTAADLAAWRAIDRQWSAAPSQAALVMMRDTHPEECWVMRQVITAKWPNSYVWSESQMELSEVISA